MKLDWLCPICLNGPGIVGECSPLLFYCYYDDCLDPRALYEMAYGCHKCLHPQLYSELSNDFKQVLPADLRQIWDVCPLCPQHHLPIVPYCPVCINRSNRRVFTRRSSSGGGIIRQDGLLRRTCP